jgi:hypothetical protein
MGAVSGEQKAASTQPSPAQLWDYGYRGPAAMLAPRLSSSILKAPQNAVRSFPSHGDCYRLCPFGHSISAPNPIGF